MGKSNVKDLGYERAIRLEREKKISFIVSLIIVLGMAGVFSYVLITEKTWSTYQAPFLVILVVILKSALLRIFPRTRETSVIESVLSFLREYREKSTKRIGCANGEDFLTETKKSNMIFES